MTVEQERTRRWRLILGQDADAPELPQAAAPDAAAPPLSDQDAAMDRVLQALYDSDRKAGLGSSSPKVNRWLGDIRRFFPTSVVKILQRDALERLKLREMLLQPETLEAVVADVQLVATLLTLKQVIPDQTRETARSVVRKVVRDVEQRLRQRLVSSIQGAIDQSARKHRPRAHEIDWDRTIRKNLRHYQPQQQILIPEQLIGHARRTRSLQDVVLCVDQSGSMSGSVVYSGIFAAVMASLPSLRTQFVVFDSEVVDLTEQLHDPVELLFSVQLGGGTDINRAIGYCGQIITRPAQTTLLLISDLFDGGDTQQLLRRLRVLVAQGVQVICLLALDDEGTPAYHQPLAGELAELGIPAFGCTPDLFPELLAAALRRGDLARWAAQREVVIRNADATAEEAASESWSLPLSGAEEREEHS